MSALFFSLAVLWWILLSSWSIKSPYCPLLGEKSSFPPPETPARTITSLMRLVSFSCIRETVFLNWDHRKGIERVYSRFQFVRREIQIYHCERLFGYGPGQTYFKKEGFIFSLTHGSFCELGESLQC
ncbi:hypothetical protein RhiirA4_417686 [Rhizophagus irregularis]|uniref:Uncharacterized protein n=1 Tax=Rhizophagus irregularis TaxID=588596 RepID=A0A2I1G7T4_9GLOM|nr:hypothetical protein RhiirA4_417686 [Rhizophagus irregularis]